jgi:hypothetical protein
MRNPKPTAPPLDLNAPGAIDQLLAFHREQFGASVMMAQIAVAPIVIKDAIITVGADSYEKHCSSATFQPNSTQPTVTWQGMSPSAQLSDVGAVTTQWSLVLEYAQDWETVNSLSNYLLTNAGQTKSVTVQPQRGTGKKAFTATVTIMPGPIGGKVNEVPVGSVTLPVTGAPVPGAGVA